MKIIRDAAGLVPYHGNVFVPTMGALHEGHFALVREAARLRAASPTRPPVVVSVFVNPTQFNDPKDLARYPRTLDADAAGCEHAGADVVFAPDAAEIYPPGTTIPTPHLPAVATQPGLEDAHRPGHFAGVCQVVKRLFDLVRPGAALFGEKDWQQLQVISAMTREENLDVRIIPCPTIREADGLAMSSRNVFLTSQDRPRALALSRALVAAQSASDANDAETRMRHVLAEQGVIPEYAVVRNASTLMPLSERDFKVGGRALIAARLGAIRLIDNAPCVF